MAYLKPTAKELTFAYRLLLYLHANLNNTYLLLAIIAWTRSESGQNWIGNNPLNIRNSPYATGYRQIAGNGHFATFKDVGAAAKATAAFLMDNHGNGYELMLSAARRDGGAKDYAKQAIDFLLALVVSKWDSGHYGLRKQWEAGHGTIDPNLLYTTTLYHVWNGILGHKITLPVSVVPQPPQPTPPPAPDQPRTLEHAVPHRDYIQPYAALSFYERRDKAPITDPGDPSTTGLQ